MFHTILGGSPVILWISLGGKPKWLPLKLGYHDVMRTRPIPISNPNFVWNDHSWERLAASCKNCHLFLCLLFLQCKTACMWVPASSGGDFFLFLLVRVKSQQTMNIHRVAQQKKKKKKERRNKWMVYDGNDKTIFKQWWSLTSMQMENIRTVLAEISNARKILHASVHELFHVISGVCAHYVMVSKFQWKPLWLATQLDPQNDWTGWQNRVNYDVFTQAPFCTATVLSSTCAYARMLLYFVRSETNDINNTRSQSKISANSVALARIVHTGEGRNEAAEEGRERW